MAKPKTAKVNLNEINLIDLEFKENPSFKETANQINVAFRIGIKHKLIKRNLLCLTNQRVIVFPELEISPFSLTVEMQGTFSVEKEEELDDLEEFCKLSAPSVMFPYIRSIISDLTSKSAYPTLDLPLINMEKTVK